MAFGLDTGPESVVTIKVIGVGGGGSNVVNRMVRSGVAAAHLRRRVHNISFRQDKSSARKETSPFYRHFLRLHIILHKFGGGLFLVHTGLRLYLFYLRGPLMRGYLLAGGILPH